jgi:hypothetical protein
MNTNTNTKYKIQIQNTNTKYKYKIQIQNTNTKYKIQIQNTNTKYKYKIQIQNTNTKKYKIQIQIHISLGLNKYSMYFKTFINLAVNQSVNGIGAMQRRRNNTLERMMAYKPANMDASITLQSVSWRTYM